MKIRLLVSLSGADGARGPGDEYNAENAEAKRLIEAGYAEPVAEKPVKRAETREAKPRKRLLGRKHKDD